MSLLECMGTSLPPSVSDNEKIINVRKREEWIFFFPYSCQFFLQHPQQAEIGDQLVGKILSIVKNIISCSEKYVNCSGKYSEDGSKKNTPKCCFVMFL